MEGKEPKKLKRWFFRTLLCTLLALAVTAGAVAVVDPYFHYHAPLDGLSYRLYSERYQNDGILRHFSYDAIITGTSMTQNFLCSQFDSLWDANSVKLTLAGARFKETDQQLRRSIAINPDLRYVIRGLDARMLLDDPDLDAYEGCPEYLYDNDPLNDVSYLLNKNVLFEDVVGTLAYTVDGSETTSFDDYVSWRDYGYSRGRDAVLPGTAPKQEGEEAHLTDAQRSLLRANMEQNVIETVRKNPDITFYYFIPPYSICYWQDQWAENRVFLHVEAQQAAIEAMLPYDNLQIFSFDDVFSLTTDLDMYINSLHYVGEINDWIMQCIHDGEHRITQDNYLRYIEEIRTFYANYDYDSLYTS